MAKDTVPVVVSAILGATVGVGLSTWQQAGFPGLVGALLPLGLALAVALPLILIPWYGSRTRAVPWMTEALLVLIAALVGQLAVGVPLQVLGLAVAGGALVGVAGSLLAAVRAMVARPWVAGSVIALVGGGIVTMVGRSEVLAAPAAPLVLALTGGGLALLLALLPDVPEPRQAHACVDTFVFGGLWLSLGLAFAPPQPWFAALIWLAAAVAAAYGALGWRRLFCDRLCAKLIWPWIKRQLLALQVAATTRAPHRYQLDVLTRMYDDDDVSPPERRAILADHAHTTPPIWSLLAALPPRPNPAPVEPPRVPYAGYDPFEDPFAELDDLWLEPVPPAQLGPLDELRDDIWAALADTAEQPAAQRALARGIEADDERIWGACLEALLPHNPDAAVEACRSRFRDGHPEPLWSCIGRAEGALYADALRDLETIADTDEARDRVRAFLEGQLTDRDWFEATAAALSLHRLRPGRPWGHIGKRGLQAVTELAAKVERVAREHPDQVLRADSVRLLGVSLLLAQELSWKPCLQALERLSRAAGQKEVRALALHQIAMAVRVKREEVWRACLTALHALDPAQARDVAWAFLGRGSHERAAHLLAISSDEGYRTRVQELAGQKNQHAMALLEEQANTQLIERAAVAMAGLLACNRAVLPRIFANRRTDDIADALSDLADRAPDWRVASVELLGMGLLQAEEPSWRPCLQELERLGGPLGPAETRGLALHQIAMAVRVKREKVWGACLTALHALDPARAVNVAWTSLAGGSHERATYLLAISSEPEYRTLVQELAGQKNEHAAALLKAQADTQPIERAAVAMVGMLAYDPDVLPRIFADRRAEGIAGALCDLADKAPGWRPAVAATFQRAASVPPSSLNAPGSLREALYPFTMRGHERSRVQFHLEEVLATPATSVNGSRISAWSYPRASEGGAAADMLLVGHGNKAVCRTVTNNLNQIIHDRTDDAGRSWMLVLGACWLAAEPPQTDTSDPLARLDEQLELLAEDTGLVARTPSVVGHAELVEEVRRRVADKASCNKPVLLDNWKQAPSGVGLMLPITTFEAGGACAPLSLTLRWDLFGPPLAPLLEHQHTLLERDIKADATARLIIYQEWLANDTDALADRAAELARQLLNDRSLQDQAALARAYQMMLHDEAALHELTRAGYRWLQEGERTPWFSAHAPDLTPSRVSELTPQQMAQRIAVIVDSLPDGWQDAYACAQLQALHQLIAQRRLMAPAALPPVTPQRVGPLLQHSLPVQGLRNYPLARVEAGQGAGGRVSALQSLLELPSSIAEDRRWIADARGTLDDVEANRQQVARVSLGLLIDAFLRGWPPHLFEDRAIRAAYYCWCRRYRRTVWKEIHAQLTAAGRRIEPLLARNVVFVARRQEQDSITIEPRFIADSRDLLILVHPHIGMTWYLDRWEHRRLVEEWEAPDRLGKRARARAALNEAAAAVEREDIDRAVEGVTAALRIQPAWALRSLLARAWPARCHDPHLPVRQRFAEAVEQFVASRQVPPACVLDDFIACYPALIPDPYMLSAYRSHEGAEPLAGASAELERLVHALPEPAFWERWQRFVYEAGRAIWATAHQRNNTHMATARDIDWEFVEGARRMCGYRPSPRFTRHLGPLLDLQRAQEYQCIATDLQSFIDGADDSTLRSESFRMKLEQMMDNTWLEPTVTQVLLNLRATSKDATDRALDRASLRIYAKQVVAAIEQQILICYKRASDSLVVHQARKQLILQRHASSGYRAAWRCYIPPVRLPLGSGWPGADTAVRTTELSAPEQIGFSAERGAVWTREFEGEEPAEVLGVARLTDAKAGALADAFTQAAPDLLSVINGRVGPLRPVYAALFEPITPAPQLRCWSQVARKLERAVITTMVHHPIIRPLRRQPAPEQRRLLTQVMRQYDAERIPVVVRVDVSVENVFEDMERRYPGYLPPRATDGTASRPEMLELVARG